MTGRVKNTGNVVDGWPEGTGMIYLGMSAWDVMWKSRHQLMSRFSRHMPVLYVEPPVTLRALRSGRVGFRRLLRDLREPAIRPRPPNVCVMRPSYRYPVSGSKLLSAYTRRRWFSAIRSAAADAGIRAPILWLCRPEMHSAVGQLGEQLSIYHIVDEYAGYTGLGSEAVQRLRLEEERMLDAVDMSVAASPEILNAKSAPHRDLVVLENGVSFSAYSEARRAGAPPKDIADIPGPRIGYSGLISKRLNLDMIAAVAAARPEWSITMVGRVDSRECESAMQRLSTLPNVHFLGEKPPADVPAYVCAFDVGLLPYAINLETQHISPIKMYEYWAAGIPAVGTDIPAVRRNRDAVHVADDADGFLTAIGSVLDNFTAAERSRLLERAEVNAWSDRVARVSREIDARLARKTARSAHGAPGLQASPSWKGS